LTVLLERYRTGTLRIRASQAGYVKTATLDFIAKNRWILH